MVDTECSGAPVTGSPLRRDRWLRLRVPNNGDRGDADRPLPDVSADLNRADDDETVTGIELTIDSIDSVEEMNAFLDEFDDRDVRIGNLVVELR